MNKLVKNILIIFFIFIDLRVFAQEVIIFNPSPDFFIFHKAIENAAAFDNKHLFTSVNYRNRIGAASEIKDLYLDLSLAVKEKQHIGFKVYSEQETSIFSKNKINLFYAYTINFSQKIELSFAGQGGISNIYFQGTNANVGGSDLAPDLSLSSFLKINSFYIGATANQITSSKIRPINYEFTLSRYYASFLVHSIDLSPLIKLNYGFNAKFSQDFFLLDLNAEIDYQETYGILAKIGRQNSFAAGAFTTIENLADYNLKIALSYSNSYYSGISGTNSVAIFLSFSK